MFLYVQIQCSSSSVDLKFIFFFTSSGQRALEDFEVHLSKEEDRRDQSDFKLRRASKVLVSVKAGVEHLAEKLQHLKAVSKPFLM